MPEELSIIIPVFNEGTSFPALWQALISNIHSDFRAYVIYDFAEDDTVPAAQKIIAAGEKRLHLVLNSVRRGVLGAILTGFEAAQGAAVLVVMADLCDDLSCVDRMVELHRQGYHLVAASRYMRGGGIENGPLLKQNLSRLGSVSLHWLRRIPTHDATNAFKLYDREMLRSIDIESRGGFELNLEITVKAFLAGYRIIEIPTVWRERQAGKSKFKLFSWLPQYLKWYFYAFRPRCKFSQSSRR
jgi:glycosyltransferase involved in cell wall biosynthesis